MQLLRAMSFACALAAIPAGAFADDLLVPKQYRTIEDAGVHAHAGDRIIVRGGHYANVELKRGDVTIVGRGATLAGNVWVDASKVTLEGFLMRDGATVVVTGQDDAVVGNRSAGGAQYSVLVKGGVRPRVEGNRMSRGTIEVLWGTDVVVKSNLLDRAGISVTSDDATITSNTVRRAAFGIAVTGNRPTVTGNVLRVGFRNPQLDSYGADFAECPGVVIVATEPGGTIADNDVTHTRGTGIALTIDGATVRDNSIRGISSSCSLGVTGSSNTVVGNTISHTGSQNPGGVGVVVEGDANVIQANRVTATASDGIAVYAGSGNVLTDNVLDRTHGCGILVAENASGTAIADCTVTGCNRGIVNLSGDTSVTDSTARRNRWADVLDLAGFSSFDGNTFGTLSHDTLLAPNR